MGHYCAGATNSVQIVTFPKFRDCVNQSLCFGRSLRAFRICLLATTAIVTAATDVGAQAALRAIACPVRSWCSFLSLRFGFPFVLFALEGPPV